MSLPRFVVCGVPRCGTTSLYRYLEQHPQVDVGRQKESNFLSWPGPAVADRLMPWVEFPVTSVEEYRSLFEVAGAVPVDVSPSCFHSPAAIERIRTYVPEAGLILLLRDPVARAYSAYLNRVRKRYETRSPEDVLVPGDRAVDNGFYAARLEAFLDAFGPQRLRVWLFDDLSGRPRPTVGEILEHLGVDATVPLDLAKVHNRSTVDRAAWLQRMVPRPDHRWRLARKVPRPLWRVASRVWDLTQTDPPPLPDAVERRLRELYADDVRRVGELLGRDLGAWLPPGSVPERSAGSVPERSADASPTPPGREETR
jgi:Sulfotransferase family